MNQKLPILTVMRTQTEFPRFLIQDDNERVWTGERFHANGAALFANQNDACLEVHSILKRHFDGIEPKRYVVPCFIEVFSEELVSEVEVASFLSKATRLELHTNEYGNGPNNSLVLPVIDWKRIEEIKEMPNV